MAQYDFGTIDPNTKSGTALASDLNSYRNAVNSMHSGSAAPSYITAGMMWVDTTSANYEVKLYDGAQSITVAIIDATNNVARVAVDPAETSYITSTTSAQIRHVIASTNIFTTRSTGIQFNLASPTITDNNSNELVSFTTTASAVNQIDIANAATGGAVNLSAVGSDTNISIALTPKGDGGVGIGTASPRASLDLTSIILADDYQLLLSSLRPNIVFEDTSGSSATDFQLYGDGNALAFLYGDASTNIKLASEAMRITNAGNVGIGTTNNPTAKLEVAGSVKNSIGELYSLRNVVYLTTGTAATYTPTAGTKAIRVTCVGGGGGGGGVDGQGAGTGGAAGGGGAGGVAYEFISSVAASYTYTVSSTGGAGGAAGDNAGAAGGTTTFSGTGVSLSATGGGGGAGRTGVAGSGARGAGGAGGTATGGDLNVSGASGTDGFTSIQPGSVGNGGPSVYGGMGRGGGVGSSGSAAGAAATGFNAGGGGATSIAVADNVAGGAGGAGLIIVEELA